MRKCINLCNPVSVQKVAVEPRYYNLKATTNKLTRDSEGVKFVLYISNGHRKLEVDMKILVELSKLL